jgi:VanZ family protein
VSKFHTFLKYWLPVFLWMTLIFSASADPRSYEHSEKLFGLFEPFLHWLFPQMTPEQIGNIHHLFRKCGHVTEYAIFALLLWRAMRQPLENDSRPWSWPQAGGVLAVVCLYAVSDEFHQRFVPTRTAHVTDVFIDTGGGATALFALWIYGRWRKRW